MKPSGEASRSAFEQDYDRIIFSYPFRRLQDKTQVHPLPEHDFVHTRLTHSLEVSSVGRSIGKKVGEVLMQRWPSLGARFSLFDFGAVVAAASLAHDLGNPPFGHAGENAISDFFGQHPELRGSLTDPQWADLINFEGNAQGFRLLNKDEFGLRLTSATLGAFTKYPCPSLVAARDKNRKSQKKFGFFESERETFASIAAHLELLPVATNAWVRHPLAFLVEAADDICYGIIDLEDGCRLGLVSFDETLALLAPILGNRLNLDKLNRSSGLDEKLGVLRAMTIGVLIESVTQVFLDQEAFILNGSMDEALTDQCVYKDALRAISTTSVSRIYQSRQVVEIEAAGHEVLPGLLNEFTTAALRLMNGVRSRKFQNLALLFPEEIRHAMERDPSDRYRTFRLVVDFISGMTDRHALSLYRKIKGISA